MGAGSSQAVKAVGDMMNAVAAEKDAARRSCAGYVGEREVCRALSALALDGVHHFDDRRLAGDVVRRANIDHLVVAPSGVYVVDAKNWSGRIAVRGHSLVQDGIARDERLVALAYLRNRVAEAVATTSAAHVVPQSVVCFARPAPGLPPALDGIHLTDVHTIGDLIQRRSRLLTNEQIAELVDMFGYAFPPYVHDAGEAAEAEGLLFPEEATRHAGLVEALSRPIKEWMVWLHPEQASAVRRRFDGPARIRGVAGTGKTVVGLHRVAWLASTRPGRFLVTSFVGTLPRNLEDAYQHLSPATADRVDFRTVHRVALDILAERGHRVRPDRGTKAFGAAWQRAGRAAELRGLHQEYVSEEIAYVIKGRGIDSYEEYQGVERPGRRAPLGRVQRQAVWDVAVAYAEELRRRGQHDFTDVLRLAYDAVVAQPCDTWRGVLVDEVQDIPLVALKLLHELAGRDRHDGLLLVGDGQQAIYPGGFRLAEANIELARRAVVLHTNYRNTVEILAAARTLAVEDTFDAPDGDDGTRVVRHGAPVVDVTFANGEAHDDAFLWELNALLGRGVAPSEVGVLCPTNAEVRAYVGRLNAALIPAAAVTQTRASVNDAVTVTTWHRVKGLEFAHVFVPRVDRGLTVPADAADPVEWLARQRRALYVAMTRARDTLWVGRVA